ncbi:MAG: flavodoxin family protein [Deltaproteobacteria bacterium]|jgi:multimeric flavodoxin WrbA|nr:flavodoxin family protein [Deltaproteobacteria bacterium]
MINQKKLVVGINGGPRKGWNTDQLITEALRGAADEGAETQNFFLYQLNFKGCISCFSCKKPTSFTYGKCAYADELSPVLTLLENATGVVMGSPIYISDITGVLRSFVERYVFSNITYDRQQPALFKKGPALALIYTMGIPEFMLEERGYTQLFALIKSVFGRFNAPFIEELVSCDTLQFKDYSKFHASAFNPDHKQKRRNDHFPLELKKAYEIGRRLGQNTETLERFPREVYTTT